MEFVNDIFSLRSPQTVTFNLIGAKLPSNRDLFFRAKQQEIFERYETARIFLRETETNDWSHWFETEEKGQAVFELIFASQFYEAALMFYNIIVDLSWTICYVSAEYVLYEKDKSINFSGMLPIEEAYVALRKAENIVTNPNSQDNPFVYLKYMCPEFSNAIDLIIEFWKNFGDSNIRKLYNYIKHKGKPLYEEIEAYKQGKVMGLQILGEEYPTEIREVQKIINFKSSVTELQVFDDTILFPYIKNLFKLLEEIIEPSPMIF